MANPNPITWGRFDTPEQATFAFASRNVLPRAASYNITWQGLRDTTSPTLIKQWYVLGVGHVLIRETTIRTSAAKLRKGGLLIAALNSLAFQVPNEEKFNADGAALWVKTSVVGYMNFMRVAGMSNLDDATYAAALIAGGPLNGIANIPNTLAGWHINEIPNIANNDWVTIINWLVSLIRGVDDHINLLLYTSMYIGLAKRGTVSDAKLDKLRTAITEEVGVDPPLNEDLIGSVYRAFGKYIDETNAGQVFDRWGNYMNDRSLSMRILLMQTSHAGLTAIETIRTALNVFPGCDWPEVIKLLPSEVPFVREALQVTQNNPYYGFKHDISGIASTKYKTFSWFAKELLIRKGGPQYEGLRNYRGWTHNPMHRNRLVDILDNFDPNAEGEVTQEHRDIEAILKGLAAARNQA